MEPVVIGNYYRLFYRDGPVADKLFTEFGIIRATTELVPLDCYSRFEGELVVTFGRCSHLRRIMSIWSDLYQWEPMTCESVMLYMLEN